MSIDTTQIKGLFLYVRQITSGHLTCPIGIRWLLGVVVLSLAGSSVGAEPTSAHIYAAAQAKAVQQVIASSQSPDPFLRANAIEAASHLSDRVGPLTHAALSDAAPVVRFAALTTIGKLKLSGIAPAARPYLGDGSPSVRAAAVFALERCGLQVDASPLAGMLASLDPKLRGNAAMLIGQMGSRSAVPMLNDLVKVPMPRASAADEAIARIQFAEALVLLGDYEALAPIRASAYSQFDEVRVLAVSMMGRLADRRMEKAIAQLLAENPIELRVAAAEALARMGRPEGQSIVLDALGSQIDTVRAQAALAAQQFHDAEMAAVVAGLLDDSSEPVRLSAAATVCSTAQ